MDGLKKIGKSVLGYLTYTAGLHRSALDQRAVIVAFHRISDSESGQRLNCTPAVFEGLCRFFRKHFSVMPLSELLERIRQNQPLGHMLSITFDDGYKDNFDVAAPILRRYGLPATFFVSTKLIGSATVPAWDEEDGFESEWMTWSDVRELREQGFEIGGHTMNHANLAELSEEEARREIGGCREMLAGELGENAKLFAYPFGGENHITSRARDIIASSGFECCLSCHGGTVSPGDDVFELRREPINTWVSRPYQYGFELLRKLAEESQ